MVSGEREHGPGVRPATTTGASTTTTAAAAAIVTGRARAEEALRTRDPQLDLLARTARRLIAGGCGEVETLRTVFADVAGALDAELFFNYLTPDGKPKSLRLATSGGLTDDQKELFSAVAFGRSLCVLVARRRERVVVEDLQWGEYPEAAALLRAAGAQAYAGFPLLAGGRLIGTIAFATRDRSRFRAGEVRLAQTVCDQLATTLERARAEELLRASEERLRLVVEGAQDYAILTTDAAGRITSWSPGAERTFGHAEGEAVGRHVSIIFTPEDRERGVPDEEMRRAREEGRAPGDRWHLGKKGGARVYVSGILAPLRDGKGAVTGYAKIARDLTGRRATDGRRR